MATRVRPRTTLPAQPLQELLHARLRAADTQVDLLQELRCNSTALKRVLTQKRVSIRVADNWCTRMGTHIALLYPDLY
jgi:hypothetical protein